MSRLFVFEFCRLSINTNALGKILVQWVFWTFAMLKAPSISVTYKFLIF